MEKRELSNYKSDLFTDLEDSTYAAEYLSASIRESRKTFLLALRDVVDAQRGMAGVATDAQVNRENLYRMLSESGNPRLSSLSSVLDALGLRIAIEPIAEQPESETSRGHSRHGRIDGKDNSPKKTKFGSPLPSKRSA